MKTRTKLTGALRRHGPALAVCTLAAAAILLPEVAMAGTAQGMPWEGNLTKFKDSITGPVALAVAFVAAVGCFIGLAIGGEMNEFLRKGIMVVIAISGIVGVASFMSMFNATGAIIATGGLPGFS